MARHRLGVSTRWRGGNCCSTIRAPEVRPWCLPQAGLTGPGYLNIHDQISPLTTSVLYDRGNRLERPRSTAAQEPRSPMNYGNCCVSPEYRRYLLTSATSGGDATRRFAQRFRMRWLAYSFLEPAHEGFPPSCRSLRCSATFGNTPLSFVCSCISRFYRGLFERMFAQWPDSLRNSHRISPQVVAGQDCAR